MDGQRGIRLMDLNQMGTTLELLALQMAAYLKEAELIGLTDIPPLFESPDSVRSSGEEYYGLYESDKLAGAAAVKWETQTLDNDETQVPALRICRLMVQPNLLRQGIASDLLAYILRMAAERKAVTTVLAVSTNPAAVALYTRFGFRAVREFPSYAGLRLYEMLQDGGRAL